MKTIKNIINFSFIKDKTITECKELSFDVVGIGNAVVDYTILTKDLKFIDIFKLQKNTMNPISSNVFEDILQYFSTQESPIKSKNFCGSVANTINILNSNKVKSLLISSVGFDQDGNDYIKNINHNLGINIINDANTFKSLIIVTPDNSRTMCTVLDEKIVIDFDSIKQNILGVLKNTKILIIEGYLFFNSDNIDAVEKICILAKQHNIIICVCLSDENCLINNKDRILYIINHFSNFISSNEDEFNIIREDINNNILKIITMDSRGARIEYNNNKIQVSTKNNIKIIDTTGAGDAFLAGFLNVIIKNNCNFQDNEILKNAIESGNVIASKIIQKIGAGVL